MDTRYRNKEWLQEQFKKVGYKQTIGKMCGVTGDTIEYWRKKFNIDIPTDIPLPGTKYSVDVSFFSNIDTEEKAYWLGFIMADGAVVSTGRSIRFDIILKQDDAEHLNKLNNALNSTYPVVLSSVIDKRTGSVNPKAELKINSVKFCRELIDAGVQMKKTGHELIPGRVLKELYPAFIRGFFDGDGCICKVNSGKYYRMHLGSCSIKIIMQIQSYLRSNNIDIKRYETHRYNIPFYYLDSTKKDTCNRFYHLIYDNAIVYLDRKYALAQDSFRICSPAE